MAYREPIATVSHVKKNFEKLCDYKVEDDHVTKKAKNVQDMTWGDFSEYINIYEPYH